MNGPPGVCTNKFNNTQPSIEMKQNFTFVTILWLDHLELQWIDKLNGTSQTMDFWEVHIQSSLKATGFSPLTFQHHRISYQSMEANIHKIYYIDVSNVSLKHLSLTRSIYSISTRCWSNRKRVPPMSLPWHHQDHTWWHSYLHGQQCHRPCSFNKTSNACIQNIHYIHSSKLRSRKSDVINTIQKLENIGTLNELKTPFKKGE